MPFESVYLDFTTLTQCDHIILTEGTFGWWAGWLLEQRTKFTLSVKIKPMVLYYRHPVYNNTWGKKFVGQDVFPKHWLSYTNQSVEFGQ